MIQGMIAESPLPSERKFKGNREVIHKLSIKKRASTTDAAELPIR